MLKMDKQEELVYRYEIIERRNRAHNRDLLIQWGGRFFIHLEDYLVRREGLEPPMPIGPQIYSLLE